MLKKRNVPIMVGLAVMTALSGAYAQQAPSDTPNSPAATTTPTAAAATPEALVLGSVVIMRFYETTGGLTPQDRVDAVTTRISNLLGIPGIVPGDVVVWAPPGKSPAIYAVGRRLLTIDGPMTRAAHGTSPLVLAKTWAARLQQILPRINYRPSNAPEPVIPLHPRLLVTADFTQVGGMAGAVSLHGKNVIFLYGPQDGGMTAQERADMLTARINSVARRIPASSVGGAAGTSQADALVQVLPVAAKGETTPAAAKSATFDLCLNGVSLLDVTPLEARAAGAGSPKLLANVWARNIRQVLVAAAPAVKPAAAAAPPAATVGG